MTALTMTALSSSTRGAEMKTEIIAAVARNRAIGRKGQIPWHLSADLKHFKEVTMGHPVIMGRRTFESIGRALPGRLNIVVSAALKEPPQGTVLCRSLAEALETSAKSSALSPMVIGGARLYAEALPLSAVLHLTAVELEPEGCDAFFPEFDAAAFSKKTEFNGVSPEGVRYAFETWTRR